MPFDRCGRGYGRGTPMSTEPCPGEMAQQQFLKGGMTTSGEFALFFPVTMRVPLNVSNSSRENAIRTNLGRQLETMTLVQLNGLLQELHNVILVSPETWICLSTDPRAGLSAAEIGSAVAGVIHARKQAVAVAAKEPPAPAPSAAEMRAPSFFSKSTLFWGGVALAAILLVNQTQGGTKRAGF